MIETADPTTTPTERFTRWAVLRLGLNIAEESGEVFALTVPEDAHEAFEGAEIVRYTFEKDRFDSATAEQPVELVAPGGRLLTWLVERVRVLGNVTHAVPRHEPASVHELAAPLLAAYQVDEGRVHLAGCTLEPLPILRLSYRLRLESLEPRDELIHVYAGPEGQPIAPEVANELGFDDLIPVDPPPQVARAEIDRLVQTSTALAEDRRRLSEGNLAESLLPRKLTEIGQLEDYFDKTQRELLLQRPSGLAVEEQAAIDEQLSSLDEQKKRRLAAIEERYSVQGRVELVAAILIWCKRAAGKLRFTIDPLTADLPFQDWSALLRPPPYICPYSRRPTHHLAATDDGRIAAMEEIASCAISGKRVMRSELVTCSVTNQAVLADLTETCRATGRSVLRDRIIPCPVCTLGVSPAVIRGQSCVVCPAVRTAPRDDPHIARVLHEYPGLDRWSNWKLAETPAVYLLSAAGIWRQLMVVLDKQSLDVLRIAGKNRLTAHWIDLPKPGYDEVLR